MTTMNLRALVPSSRIPVSRMDSPKKIVIPRVNSSTPQVNHAGPRSPCGQRCCMAQPVGVRSWTTHFSP